MVKSKTMETKTGVITRIIYKNGYGFIKAKDGQDYFFHMTGVVEPDFKILKEGDNVEFLQETTAKGEKAIKIVKM